MRHLNYRRTLDTTLYPSDRMQSHQTSFPALLIANLFRSHELNAQFNCVFRGTENTMALPQTVGWNAEWNRHISDTREIRNRTVPDRKKKEKRPSKLNHRESGKLLVKGIANSSPLLAYDLLKCIQFVCLRSSSFGYKDTVESCCKSREMV